MTTPEEREQLEGQAEPGLFLTRLADIIGAHARASTVFASPVRENGVTVIPVARAMWGVGGGAGRQPQGSGRGGTGGGGMIMKPVGFIAISHGRARFRRLLDPALIATAAVAGATAALVALRASGLWRRRR
jgi:uncharacterized spore protein YtfJ